MSMSLNNDYELFYCGCSTDKHFYIDPVSMSCGHHICKQCIPLISTELTCCLCGKVNKINLNDMEVSLPAKALVHIYFDELLIETRKRFFDSLCNYKEFKQSLIDDINSKTASILNDIEMRVDLLKCELDAIKMKMKFEVEKIKNIFINEANQNDGVKIERHEKKLKELIKDIEIKEMQSESKFNSYQNSIKSLHKSLENLKLLNHQIKFNTSNTLIDPSLIGLLEYRSNKPIPPFCVNSKSINLNPQPNESNQKPKEPHCAEMQDRYRLVTVTGIMPTPNSASKTKVTSPIMQKNNQSQ